MSGRATLIPDDSVTLFPQTKSITSDHVLILFKMMRVEYYDTISLYAPSLKTRIKDFFSEILFPQQYREFYFPEPAI